MRFLLVRLLQLQTINQSIRQRARFLSTSVQLLGKAVDLDSLPPKSREIIKREAKVTCHNYASVPAVLARGEGVFVWDVDGE